MSLLAAYAFDENSGTTSTDASGNSRTATVATWAIGRTGSAAAGDATHSSMHYSGTVVSSPTALTYMYWFCPTVATGGASIDWVTSDAGGGGGASSGVWISTYWNDSTHLGLGVEDGSGNNHTSASVTTALNTWVHVAVTWTGSTATLYLNGTSAAVVSTTNISLLSSVSWIEAGGAQNSDFHSYNMGRVDEYRLYDTALTSAQIVTCMNTPIATLRNPIALMAAYPFDEGGGLTAIDVSGNSRDIAITAGSWTSGKNGWGVVDNSASNVTIGPGSLSSRTVMCWFRIDSDTGDSQALVSSQPSGSNLNVLYVDPSGGWTVGYYDATTSVDVSTPLSLTFGTWYHVAVTTGLGGVKLYLNGTLVASNASTACRGLTNAYVGKGADGNGPLDGAVDGLRTFDTALSANEISMYMNTPTWQGPYVAGTTYTTVTGNASTFDVRPEYHVLTGSVQVGDWLVVVLSSATNLPGTNVPTPPGGWTTIVSFNTVGSGTMCFGVYARKYDTADATYTWSQTTGSGQTTCRMFFVRGADDISNWVLGSFDYRQNTGTTSTSVAASITTTTANSLALIIGGERTLAAETESQISCSNSYEFYFDNISDHSLTGAIKPMPSAGSTGSVTITYPNTHNYNGIAGIIGIPPISTSETITWTL